MPFKTHSTLLSFSRLRSTLVAPLILAWLIGLIGCRLPTLFQPQDRVCTLMGCVDSLVVELRGQVPHDFVVEVTAPDGAMRRAHCVAGQAEASQSVDEPMAPMCEATSVSFFGFLPDEATIKITWEGGESVQTVHPSYSLFRPNGPACPPECRTGHAQLEVP